MWHNSDFFQWVPSHSLASLSGVYSWQKRESLYLHNRAPRQAVLVVVEDAPRPRAGRHLNYLRKDFPAISHWPDETLRAHPIGELARAHAEFETKLERGGRPSLETQLDMCCNGELNSRQEHQQGSGQQKVSAGAGTWGGSRDQLCLKLAGLLRSPRSFCRNVCGWKAGEDWRSGSPNLGSSSCPLCGPSYVSWGHSVSSGQRPRPHTLITPMPCDLTLSPSAQPLV